MALKLKKSQLMSSLRKRLPEMAQALKKDFDQAVPVDEGELRDSLSIEIVGDKIVWTYGAAYATAVHEGYSRSNGTSVPGNPWTQQGLKNLRESGSAEILKKALGDI